MKQRPVSGNGPVASRLRHWEGSSSEYENDALEDPRDLVDFSAGHSERLMVLAHCLLVGRL